MSLTKTRHHITLFAAVLTITGLTAGCASINSGLQSGEVPPTGTFVAENGITFNVQPLSLTNLPASPAYSGRYSSNTSTKNSRVRELLNQSTSNSAEYRITPGDILSIQLIGYPEITTPASNTTNPYASGYPVDQQGYIQFPLVGRVKASGFSAAQFTTNLRSNLQRYLKYPDPQVKIINYRGNKFFIDGEVRQPGEFGITDTPVSLYSAISLAGGTTPDGDNNSIILTRKGVQYELGLRDLQNMGISVNNIYLQDGDTVHVNSKDRNKVFVLGEFGSIKPIEIPDQGLSLTQLLGEVSGLDGRTADAAKLYIIRDYGNTSYIDIYHANLQSVTNLALANRFELQPNDIVYVDPTGLTRWNRVLSSILPSASALDRYAF